MPLQNKEKSEETLKKLLSEQGYSEKAATELWKWYDISKKGVASF
jgi:predicted Ser/Thr protein kinase